MQLDLTPQATGIKCGALQELCLLALAKSVALIFFGSFKNCSLLVSVSLNISLCTILVAQANQIALGEGGGGGLGIVEIWTLTRGISSKYEIIFTLEVPHKSAFSSVFASFTKKHVK